MKIEDIVPFYARGHLTLHLQTGIATVKSAVVYYSVNLPDTVYLLVGKTATAKSTLLSPQNDNGLRPARA